MCLISPGRTASDGCPKGGCRVERANSVKRSVVLLLTLMMAAGAAGASEQASFASGRPGAPAGRAARTVHAPCSPAPARLVFVRDLGPAIGNEIFTVRPDGSGLKRLTNNNTDEWGPSRSPDGTRIAFSSHRDGNGEIYVMDRNGGTVERLTENGYSDAVPEWSPDGQEIVFASERRGDVALFDLYVMPAGGGEERLLTGEAGTEANPTWSPNGRRIAFDRGDEVFSIRVDGTGLKRLTTRLRMLATNPSWSNEGRRIAFQAQTSEETGMDIYVMKKDGTRKREIVGGKGEQQSPTWSPSDTKIAFSSKWRVAVARADGSRVRTLFSHDYADYSVDWGRSLRC